MLYWLRSLHHFLYHLGLFRELIREMAKLTQDGIFLPKVCLFYLNFGTCFIKRVRKSYLQTSLEWWIICLWQFGIWMMDLEEETQKVSISVHLHLPMKNKAFYKERYGKGLSWKVRFITNASWKEFLFHLLFPIGLTI